jgi:hypothetical protein
MVHDRVHKNPLFDSVLSRFNAVHSTQLFPLNISFTCSFRSKERTPYVEVMSVRPSVCLLSGINAYKVGHIFWCGTLSLKVIEQLRFQLL